MEFSLQTMVTIQQLVYPLVKAFTGFDAQGFVGTQSELFTNVGNALEDMAGLFIVCGSALEDGLLTSEELEAIISKAKTLPEAIDEILEHFKAVDQEQ